MTCWCINGAAFDADVIEASPRPIPEDVESKPSFKATEKAQGWKNVTLNFKPGGLGISRTTGNAGEVLDVLAGGQAGKYGVCKGMRFRAIDGEEYSEALLEAKQAGDKDYTITFEEPPAAKEPEATKGGDAEADPKKDEAAVVAGDDLAELSMEFDDGGQTLTVGFKDKPLGMSFLGQQVPVVVEALLERGVAEFAGVKPGWKLKRIKGKDLKGLDFAAIMQLIRDGTEPLLQVEDEIPEGAFIIEFLNETGIPKKVGFTRRPFGMSLSTDTPVKVQSVEKGGHAYGLGIRSGWIPTKIRETDVGGESNATIMDLIKEGGDEVSQTPVFPTRPMRFSTIIAHVNEIQTKVSTDEV